MKKLIVIIVVVLHATLLIAQDKGIGIRLGDPSGITFKKYFDDNALEISIGRTHLLYNDRWYGDRFDDWYDDENFGYKKFGYLNYETTAPLGIQLHYLFQNKLGKVANEEVRGLEWYWGFGAQITFQKYRYDYRYKIYGDDDWYYASSGDVTDFDFGADAVIGLEYSFDDVPISLFLDMTLFMEVFDNPFLFHYQGGLGARYNF